MKQKSIKCPKCGLVSHNPQDIEERYCGNCHEFHFYLIMGPEQNRDGNTYRDGKVHVMKGQCANCLFSPDRLVSGASAAAIVRDTKDVSGAAFNCHKSTIAQEDAICRAWYDKFAAQDPILRLAEDMGVIEEVEFPETSAE